MAKNIAIGYSIWTNILWQKISQLVLVCIRSQRFLWQKILQLATVHGQTFCGRKYRNWSQYVRRVPRLAGSNVKCSAELNKKNIAIGYSNMDKHFVRENIAIGPSM